MKENIKAIIQRRKVKYLFHFTRKDNLERIKKEGLCLRDWTHNTTDSRRYDANNAAICLSISQPNWPMFNRKDSDGFDLCLILLKPEILYLKKCLFFPHNAATSEYKNKENQEFVGAEALEHLFDEEIKYTKANGYTIVCQREERGDAVPTSEQAEVQCLERIEPCFFEDVFVCMNRIFVAHPIIKPNLIIK